MVLTAKLKALNNHCIKHYTTGNLKDEISHLSILHTSVYTYSASGLGIGVFVIMHDRHIGLIRQKCGITQNGYIKIPSWIQYHL
jgi:hypothetical protein